MARINTFDREFLRWFFREELTQMQHATLIDEWLEEAVQETVHKTEKKAKLEQATTSILRIVTIRFTITEEQQERLRGDLQQISDVALLNIVEEQALLAFNFTDFNIRLEELRQAQPTNGSAQ